MKVTVITARELCDLSKRLGCEVYLHQLPDGRLGISDIEDKENVFTVRPYTEAEQAKKVAFWVDYQTKLNEVVRKHGYADSDDFVDMNDERGKRIADEMSAWELARYEAETKGTE